jgi:HD-like signal output (HDOD) protein
MMRWLRDLFSSKQTPSVHSPPGAIAERVSSAAYERAGAGTESPLEASIEADIESAASEASAPFAAPVRTAGISWLVREDVNANFSAWLFARSDYADLQTSRAEQAILEHFDAVLTTPNAGAQLVRRMPGVIPQLLQSLRTNDFSGTELARKISNDVVLVAEVIRLANSSIYAKEDPITSIEHAVMVLGQNGLRHLITSVAFRPIVDMKSGHFNRLVAPRLWEHSERCAIAGRLLAQGAGLNGFDAFLAGLIQNVGLIVALRLMDQEAEGNETIGSATFCNALMPKARRLSSSIAAEWNFPADVVRAIDDQAIVRRDVDLSPIGGILSMADYLGKLDLLVRNGMQRADASVMGDLSASELSCYAALETVAATGVA